MRIFHNIIEHLVSGHVSYVASSQNLSRSPYLLVSLVSCPRESLSPIPLSLCPCPLLPCVSCFLVSPVPYPLVSPVSLCPLSPCVRCPLFCCVFVSLAPVPLCSLSPFSLSPLSLVPLCPLSPVSLCPLSPVSLCLLSPCVLYLLVSLSPVPLRPLSLVLRPIPCPLISAGSRPVVPCLLLSTSSCVLCLVIFHAGVFAAKLCRLFSFNFLSPVVCRSLSLVLSCPLSPKSPPLYLCVLCLQCLSASCIFCIPFLRPPRSKAQVAPKFSMDSFAYHKAIGTRSILISLGLIFSLCTANPAIPFRRSASLPCDGRFHELAPKYSTMSCRNYCVASAMLT